MVDTLTKVLRPRLTLLYTSSLKEPFGYESKNRKVVKVY